MSFGGGCLEGDTYYMPGAAPFFFPGGPVGCVVVHGLMSSPGEMRWLGAALAAAGCTVLGVRLAAHGTDYRDTSRIRWRDWLGSVLDGWHVLKDQCAQVFLVGHSVGGVVCLYASTLVAPGGVAVLASPLEYAAPMARYSPWLRHIMRRFDTPDRSDLPDRMRAEQRQRGEPEYGRVRYDRWTGHAVAEAYRLSQATRARLPLVKAPLLTVYSTIDDVVPFANSQIIAGAAGSAIIEQHTLHNSGHNVMIDREKDTVFELVGDFVRRHSRTADSAQDTVR